MPLFSFLKKGGEVQSRYLILTVDAISDPKSIEQTYCMVVAVYGMVVINIICMNFLINFIKILMRPHLV